MSDRNFGQNPPKFIPRRQFASSGSGDLSIRSSFFEIGTAIFRISVQFSSKNFAENRTFSYVHTSLTDRRIPRGKTERIENRRVNFNEL